MSATRRALAIGCLSGLLGWPGPALLLAQPAAGITSAAPATAAAPAAPTDALVWLEDTAERLLRAGQAAQALPLVEAAWQQRQAAAAGGAAMASPALGAVAQAATTRMLLAEVLQQLGRSAEAWPHAQAAWQAALAEGAAANPGAAWRLGLQHRRALLAEQQGDEALALRELASARQAWQAQAGAPAAPLLALLRDEAGLRAQAGQVGAAQQLLAQAQALVDQALQAQGTRATPASAGQAPPSWARQLADRLRLDQAELQLRLGDTRGAGQALAALAAQPPEAGTGWPPRPRQDQVDLLRGLASVARLQGDAAAALRWLGQARALADAAPALPAAVRAALLNAQAETHRALGDFPPARTLGQAALALRQAHLPPQHPDLALSHNNLGLTALESGDLPAARLHLAEARRLWSAHPARRLEAADTAANLAGLAAAEGRWAEVDQTLTQVLAQWRAELSDSHPRVAVAQGQRAEALSHLGQPAQRAEADALFTQALATLQLREDLPVARGMAWARWADHQQRQGRADLAILGGKQAVNAFQGLRARLLGAGGPVADPAVAALQSSLVRQRQPVYLNLAARLLDSGRLAEAEAVTALLKQDELHELVRGSPNQAPVQVLEPTGAEGAAIALSPEAVAQTARRAQQLEDLLRLQRAGALPEARRPELLAARAEVQAARDRFAAYMASLPRLLKPLTAHQRDALAALNLKSLGNLQGLLRDELPAGTVLLHYLVLEDSVRILVTAAQFQQALQVNVRRAQLDDAIVELRSALRDRQDVQPIAQRLHRWLIAPVQPVLDTLDARVLMLAPTDNLRYLPFATLHDGRSWLVERYATSVYTEAAARLGARPRAQWQVQAFGTTQAHPPLAALPGVQREVEAIVGPQGLPGVARLDAGFTRARLEEALDMREPVLHIASHFVFRPGSEGGSHLLLGDGQRLSLQDIRGLDFQGADLVTLSACDTAMGGGLGEHGAEVEGLGALVQQRDARAVLASLWPVSDASTAELMQRFYRLRGSPAAPTKAEALRQAQLAFIRAAAPDASGAAEATRHPYHWAPFVLMGNWL